MMRPPGASRCLSIYIYIYVRMYYIYERLYSLYTLYTLCILYNIYIYIYENYKAKQLSRLVLVSYCAVTQFSIDLHRFIQEAPGNARASRFDFVPRHS